LIEKYNIPEKKVGCFAENTIAELSNVDVEIQKKLVNERRAIEIIYLNYLEKGRVQNQISPYKDLENVASYLYLMQSGIKTTSMINHDKSELLKTIEIVLSAIN